MVSGEDNPELIDNLIKIEQQSSHLSQTISDYRDFFKPDKPKEKFNVYTLIDNALELVDHELKNNSIVVDNDADTDIMLYSYRNEILQVFIALLKNSLDAFVDNKIYGGKILITVESYENNCYISFLDNAGGITHGVMKKLFTPYFTTKTKGQGTGLGLYMCKLIIEQHCGGAIKVESFGSQTRFILIFPSLIGDDSISSAGEFM